MTRNQQQALTLANAISDGLMHESDLSDHDWCLLLLAAGLNSAASPTHLVIRRVRDRSQTRTGYFAHASDHRPGSDLVYAELIDESVRALAG